MSITRLLLALALAAGLGGAASAAPLEAYGKLPSIESVEVSPNGKAVAFVVTNGEQRVIAVRDIATNQFLMRVGTGAAKIRYVRWADDRRLILVNSITASPEDVLTTQREWEMGFSLDVASGQLRPLMREVGQAMNTGPPCPGRASGLSR